MSSLHFLGMVVITGLTNSFQLCKQMVAQVAELIFHGWSSPEDVYDFLRQVSVVMVVAQLVFGSRSQTQVVDVYVGRHRLLLRRSFLLERARLHAPRCGRAVASTHRVVRL